MVCLTARMRYGRPVPSLLVATSLDSDHDGDVVKRAREVPVVPHPSDSLCPGRIGQHHVSPGGAIPDHAFSNTPYGLGKSGPLQAVVFGHVVD